MCFKSRGQNLAFSHSRILAFSHDLLFFQNDRLIMIYIIIYIIIKYSLPFFSYPVRECENARMRDY